jgi:carbonic anhydrase
VLPADRAYYKFMGSLTTPPCSDGVRWQVLKQPVELSKKQIAAFQKLYKMNARPVQALNGRLVEVSE